MFNYYYVYVYVYRIDADGEFHTTSHQNTVINSLTHCTGRKLNITDIFLNEIKYVQKVTEEKVEKLQYAEDCHIGMELLHLFILDLLGRDTKVARIFRAKSEEE